MRTSYLMTLSAVALLATSSFAQSQTALPPIPQSTVKQAKAHNEGTYTQMNRRELQGGEIQEAWDEVQKTDGVFNHEYCLDCTFRVRLRQHMITVVRLPVGEKITAIDVGDPKNFKTKVRNANTIAIKPIGFGGDTNMIVFGENNRVYPFYLRTESVNSKNIPDMILAINGEITSEIDIPKNDGSTTKNITAPDKAKAISDLTPDSYSTTDKNDFVEHVPFDPDQLHGWGQYELGGSKELEPLTVFRDENFTYIKYSKKTWNSFELPTAYTVIDDIDELVNTHVKGTTLVVESTAKLISLKSGQQFLCIEFEGE